MRIAIIGGGIAGLAAAYELEKARAAGAAVNTRSLRSGCGWAGHWPRKLWAVRCWSADRIPF